MDVLLKFYLNNRYTKAKNKIIFTIDLYSKD